MRYLLIAILALVAVWYFFFRTEEAPQVPLPVKVAKVLTPEEQFQALFSGKTVDAAALAPLCSAYPQLAAQILRNRQFRLSGLIQDIRLSGLDERKAEILLYGEGDKKLIMVFDLDKYARLTISERGAGKYAVVDTELLWIPRSGASSKQVLFAKETNINKLVTTKNFGATNVTFSVTEGR